MEVVKQLTHFYSQIVEDERMGMTHVCVYMALFQYWNLNGFKNPVVITRHNLMKIARISGRATYAKIMKQLQEYGYIKYLPSCNPGLGSQVYLLK